MVIIFDVQIFRILIVIPEYSVKFVNESHLGVF